MAVEALNQLHQAGDYTLETVEIISYKHNAKEQTPTRLDIKALVKTVEISESLFRPIIQGKIIVFDTQDVRTILPLTGLEKLNLKFFTPGLPGYSAVENEGHPYRIYKIDNVKTDDGNPRAQFYEIYFCSQENYTNSMTRLSQAYEGPVEDAVVKIVRNELKSTKKVFVEQTQTNTKIVMPYVKPLEAIRRLANKAVSLAYNNAGYVFYENRNGFHFRSLESLKAVSGTAVRPAKFKYSYQIANTREGGVKNVLGDLQNVLEYKFTKPVDILKQIQTGTYASKHITTDTFNKTYNIKKFNYLDYFEDHFHLEHYDGGKSDKALLPFSYYEDTNKDISQFSDAEHIMTSNTKKLHDNFERVPSEQTYQSMLHQKNIIEGLNLRLLVHGNTLLNIGDIITFDLPKMQPLGDKKQESNPYYAGRFMITGLRHILDTTSSTHQMILSCSKDSVRTKYPYETASDATQNADLSDNIDVYSTDNTFLRKSSEDLND